MDETSNRTPIAIRWKCDHHHVMENPVDGDSLMVPSCRKCWEKNQRRFYAKTGVLLYEESQRHNEDVIVPTRHYAVKQVLGTELWDQFCAVLETLQARMADGSMSRGWCRACEEQPHASVTACPCPCHVAWRFRREMEKAEAA